MGGKPVRGNDFKKKEQSGRTGGILHKVVKRKRAPGKTSPRKIYRTRTGLKGGKMGLKTGEENAPIQDKLRNFFQRQAG